MPIYEYDCGACGPFSETRSMAASSLPAPCPRCAKEAPRMLSATAVHRTGGRRRRGAEPSLVTVKDRRDPRQAGRFTEKEAAARAAAHSGGARPWMIGH